MKKKKKIIIMVLAIILIILIIALLAIFVINPYIKAVNNYNKAVSYVKEKNNELDKSIEKIEKIIDKSEKVIYEGVVTKAKEALKLTAVSGKVETQNAEVITQVENNKDNLKLEVVFTDKSVTNLDTKIDISEKLTIESNLPDGDYTLSYKAYVEGKNQTEVSTLAGYFDKRVKLKVSGNKKTVSFLNHLYADLIIDFALKNGQTYVPFTKNVVESETNGSPKKVEYTVELNDLTGTKLAAVLGSGPMGGNIEYTDMATLGKSLEGRTEIE